VNLSELDTEWIRVVGQAKSVVGTTDTSSVPEDLDEYIKAGMSMLLASRRMDENTEWKTKFYMFRDMVRGVAGSPGLEEYIYRQPRGKRVF